MKSKKHADCICNINQLRDELHRLIEHEKLSSGIVQQRSQELDALILLYYRKGKDRQALKEP